MLFFLDTNVFYGDWFFQNANFRYLFHFLNNEGHDLLLSRVVLQETENIQARELQAAVADIRKYLSAAAKLNNQPVVRSEPIFHIESYDLLALLQEKVESVSVVEYESISHSVVVERALRRVRPFQENEKGYRDTLIWLSLLDHLGKLPPGEAEVVFISANKSDFFEPNSKTLTFHPNLRDDIAKSCPLSVIQAYSSLYDFVDKTIDKDTHAIDHTKAESSFGAYVEEEGVAFIEDVQPQLLAKLQSVLTPGAPALVNAFSIAAEVSEGIEDFRILSTSDVGGTDAYVSCMYNLRRVEVKLSIPETDYLLHRQAIEGSQRFYERGTDGRYVQLTTVIRPYLTVSFIHNLADQSNKEFTVDEFTLQ